MKEWFYTITQTMLEDLGLRGTELSVFAILNGYSSQGDGCYYGTRANLAKRCGVSSLRTIDAALQSLIDKRMIEKFPAIIKGEEKTAYAVNPMYFQDVQKLLTTVQNLHTPQAEIARGEGAKSAHMNNKDIEKKDNIFIPPTPQEVADYARQRGFRSPEGFAAHFIDFYTSGEKAWHLSNGKPMKDWKRSVITWEPNNKDRIFPTTVTSVSKEEIAPVSRDQFINYLR